jgi:hypothetical protein
MNYDDRFLCEMIARNLLGEKYYHCADRFHDGDFAKGVVKKCIALIRKIVEQLECHERLRDSIHKNLDHLERSIKGKKDGIDYVPTLYALSAMWNLLGGLGRIRYWVPEYTQDVDRYLNQKEFLEGGDMITASKELKKTSHEQQVHIIKELNEQKRSAVEIAQIMSLPESRIRKILREL